MVWEPKLAGVRAAKLQRQRVHQHTRWLSCVLREGSTWADRRTRRNAAEGEHNAGRNERRSTVHSVVLQWRFWAFSAVLFVGLRRWVHSNQRQPGAQLHLYRILHGLTDGLGRD